MGSHADKSIFSNCARRYLISRDVTYTLCTRLTREVCIRMYKLSCIWPLKCRWNVNLGNDIVVF